MAIGLAHILAGVTALDVFCISTIAALAAIRVQGVRVKHFHLDLPELVTLSL